MIWVKKKLRHWLGIERNENNIDWLRKLIKERTEYHLDIHQYKDTQVIVIGRYKKRDFVKTYSLPAKSIYEIIAHCKNLENSSNKGRFDTMPEFAGVIKNELDKME